MLLPSAVAWRCFQFGLRLAAVPRHWRCILTVATFVISQRSDYFQQDFLLHSFCCSFFHQGLSPSTGDWTHHPLNSPRLLAAITGWEVDINKEVKHFCHTDINPCCVSVCICVQHEPMTTFTTFRATKIVVFKCNEGVFISVSWGMMLTNRLWAFIPAFHYRSTKNDGINCTCSLKDC